MGIREKRFEFLREYLAQGENVTEVRVGGKALRAGWDQRRLSEERLSAWDGNFARVIPEGSLVVDIDKRVTGDGGDGFASWSRLCKDYGIRASCYPFTVLTPSGGAHIYLKLDPAVTGYSLLKRKLKDYPGIDFLSKGACCNIPGSEITGVGVYDWHPDNMFGLFEIACPEILARELAYEPVNRIGEDGSLVTGEAEDDGLTEEVDRFTENRPSMEKMRGVLAKINPDCDYDTWFTSGLAMYEFARGDEEREKAALRIWEEWSEGGEKWEQGACEKKWVNFEKDWNRRGNGNGVRVTFRTLLKMGKDADFHAEIVRYKKYASMIAGASEEEIELDISPAIRKAGFGDINLEKLAVAIKDRYFTLHGVKRRAGDIKRNLVKPVKPPVPAIPVSGKAHASSVTLSEQGNRAYLENEGVPAWCKDWVYITDQTRFFNLVSCTFVKTEAFNMVCGGVIPWGKSGGKQTAVKYVTDNNYLRKLDTSIYYPHKKERLLFSKNRSALNIFDSGSIPPTAESYSKKGEGAVARMVFHMRVLVGEKRRDFFLDWLSWQVQFPGRKLRFAPLLQGFEGSGKSYLSDLLRALLGDRNVGVIGPRDVKSDFNGWSANRIVNVLQELRIIGENRYDVANALKPLITDNEIMVNDKGLAQKKIPNITNYLGFTNYRDAIPLDDGSRRWWLMFSEFLNVDELNRFLDCDSETEYFPRLFEDLREYGGEIRKFLAERVISKEFKSLKRAPITEELTLMIKYEQSNNGVEGYAEAVEILQEGGKGISQNVILNNYFFEAVEARIAEEDSGFGGLTKFAKSKLLKRLGFLEAGRGNVIQINGVLTRWRSRKPLTENEIRFHAYELLRKENPKRDILNFDRDGNLI